MAAMRTALASMVILGITWTIYILVAHVLAFVVLPWDLHWTRTIIGPQVGAIGRDVNGFVGSIQPPTPPVYVNIAPVTPVQPPSGGGQVVIQQAAAPAPAPAAPSGGLTTNEVAGWCSGCAGRLSQINANGVKVGAGPQVTLQLPSGVVADAWDGKTANKVTGPATVTVFEASVYR